MSHKYKAGDRFVPRRRPDSVDTTNIELVIDDISPPGPYPEYRLIQYADDAFVGMFYEEPDYLDSDTSFWRLK